MRILGPQKGMHADYISLPIESFKVMGHGHEVGLGGELISRMPPVPVGKDPQLSTLYQRFDFFLNRSKVHGR
jgi:hypothetical protein